MPMIDQPGSYVVKVTKKDLCYSKGGKEQVAVGFEVTDDGPMKGRHITWYGFFTDAATPYTIERLRTLGWQGADLSDLSMVGSAGDVEIVVAEEPYMNSEGEEKTSFKVQYINALGGAGMGIKNVMDDAQKRAFAARMKPMVLGVDPNAAKAKAPSRGNGTQRQAAPQRPEPPAPDDRDIPF